MANGVCNGVGFDAELHLKLIEKLGVTTFCAPPTVYRVFAQMDLSSYNLSSVRHALGAGEPLNPEVIKVWYNATGGKIYDGYGQTETINIVANYPCMPVKPGSMGKPVPGVNVQVVDEKGDICAVDCIGSIAIELTEPLQPGMFEGYWQDDEARQCVSKTVGTIREIMVASIKTGIFGLLGAQMT
ncbi:MAG: acetyl-CoA synthetase [Cycloclasticus pugetii]|jgi:acetyl-CoA synthetase